jgi:hypothetical protein
MDMAMIGEFSIFADARAKNGRGGLCSQSFGRKRAKPILQATVPFEDRVSYEALPKYTKFRVSKWCLGHWRFLKY